MTSLFSKRACVAAAFLGLSFASVAGSGSAQTSSAYGIKSKTPISPSTESYNRDFHQSHISENTTHQFDRGMINYKAGKYSVASKNFKRVLDHHPHHLQATLFLGLSKQKLGQHRQAIRYLRKSRRAYGSVPQVHVALAESFAAEGKTEDLQQVMLDIDNMAVVCAGTCSSKSDIETAQAIMQSNFGKQ